MEPNQKLEEMIVQVAVASSRSEPFQAEIVRLTPFEVDPLPFEDELDAIAARIRECSI